MNKNKTCLWKVQLARRTFADMEETANILQLNLINQPIQSSQSRKAY